MKKGLLLLMFSLVAWTSSAQLIWGLKGGISQTEVSTGELSILQEKQERYRLSVNEIAYGIHGGLVFQAYFKNFLIQPEILLSSNRVDYRRRDLFDPAVDTIQSEKYQHLDIPLLFGFQLGPLRLQAGPEAHIYLNSTAMEAEGYEQNFQEVSFGYQAGAGISLWSLLIDFRYEGNFDNFGNHLTFFGENYEFAEPPARFLLSLSVLLNRKRRER